MVAHVGKTHPGCISDRVVSYVEIQTGLSASNKTPAICAVLFVSLYSTSKANTLMVNTPSYRAILSTYALRFDPKRA